MFPWINSGAVHGRNPDGCRFADGVGVGEDVRPMPRGITTVTQDTQEQALTKTLHSTFKYLENPISKRTPVQFSVQNIKCMKTVRKLYRVRQFEIPLPLYKRPFENSF
jgi:hypothetical protein